MDRGAEAPYVLHAKNGQWNLQGLKFYAPADVNGLVVISFSRMDERDCQHFADSLLHKGAEMGMKVNDRLRGGIPSVNGNRAGGYGVEEQVFNALTHAKELML